MAAIPLSAFYDGGFEQRHGAPVLRQAATRRCTSALAAPAAGCSAAAAGSARRRRAAPASSGRRRGWPAARGCRSGPGPPAPSAGRPARRAGVGVVPRPGRRTPASAAAELAAVGQRQQQVDVAGVGRTRGPAGRAPASTGTALRGRPAGRTARRATCGTAAPPARPSRPAARPQPLQPRQHAGVVLAARGPAAGRRPSRARRR